MLFKVKGRINPETKKFYVDWMKDGEVYDVLDVYKAIRREEKVEGEKPKKDGLETWFLLGDSKTGALSWVHSVAILYVA